MMTTTTHNTTVSYIHHSR